MVGHMIVEEDLDLIRTIVREELGRIIDEQEQRLDEIFKMPAPPTHDGRLLDDDPRIAQCVQYRDNEQGLRFIAIRYESNGLDDIWLSPKQALSLRDWLNQEMPTLEHLAKEQKI